MLCTSPHLPTQSLTTPRTHTSHTHLVLNARVVQVGHKLLRRKQHLLHNPIQSRLPGDPKPRSRRRGSELAAAPACALAASLAGAELELRGQLLLQLLGDCVGVGY